MAGFLTKEAASTTFEGEAPDELDLQMLQINDRAQESPISGLRPVPQITSRAHAQNELLQSQGA